MGIFCCHCWRRDIIGGQLVHGKLVTTLTWGVFFLYYVRNERLLRCMGHQNEGTLKRRRKTCSSIDGATCNFTLLKGLYNSVLILRWVSVTGKWLKISEVLEIPKGHKIWTGTTNVARTVTAEYRLMPKKFMIWAELWWLNDGIRNL